MNSEFNIKNLVKIAYDIELSKMTSILNSIKTKVYADEREIPKDRLLYYLSVLENNEKEKKELDFKIRKFMDAYNVFLRTFDEKLMAYNESIPPPYSLTKK